MALTREEFTGNGVLGNNNAQNNDRLNYSFIALKNEDIKVKLNGVLIAPDKYTFHTDPTNAITFNSINTETTLQLTTGAPKQGVSILIYRDTDISSAKNNFSVGSSIRANDLNENQKQAIFAVKEVKDLVDDDLVRSTDTWSTNDTEIASTAAINNRIAGLAWDTTQLNSRIDTRADQRIASSAIAITTVQTAANESAHLALTTQEGDVVVRTDQNKSYVRNSGTAGTMADFTELLAPTGAVSSVNSNTGAITANQIAAAVEAASDSNTFTDADHTKLNNIETNATADQTDSEIKTAYENNSDTNAFTDAEKTKLSGIEANATADQTAEEIQDIVGAMLTSNTETGITVTYQDADGTIDFAVASQTDENFTTADHNKLDGIESGATADQTAAEIRTLVDSASDSNVFTDADHTKLNGIEASATADQTGAEIKSLYEGESDTNAFTDSEKTKLSGIETNATADQTASEIRTLVESASDSNVFTDADHTKLNGIEASATADQTDAEIRAAVEAATDSNVFTDADHTKLNGIEASADVTDATNVAAAGAAMLTGAAFTGDVTLADDQEIKLGNGNDLRIYHDSSNNFSYVREEGTGSLRLQGEALLLEDLAGDNYMYCIHDGEVRLYYDNAAKLYTTTYGIEVRGDGNSQDGAIQFNCSQNSHGVKIQAPPHSAGASYTLVLPNTDGNANQVLKTDGSGNLDWVDQSSGSSGVAATGGTFTGSVTFEDAINENVFAISDASSVALDPDNGMIQTWTLGANRTATDSLTTGQSVLLMITAGSYTLTWPTITWAGGSAPTLSTSSTTAIELWKVGSTLYGANVGDV